MDSSSIPTQPLPNMAQLIHSVISYAAEVMQELGTQIPEPSGSSSTDMIHLTFEPCPVCPEIDHLIREVEYHSSCIFSTPWNPNATQTQGTMTASAEIAMDAYKRGELSTGIDTEAMRTAFGPQDLLSLTSKNYFEDQDRFERYRDAYQALEGHRINPVRAGPRFIQARQEWLGVADAIPMDLEDNFSTRYGAVIVPKVDDEEHKVVALRLRKPGLRSFRFGFKRRMRKLLR